MIDYREHGKKMLERMSVSFVGVAQQENSPIDDAVVTENADMFFSWDINLTPHKGMIVRDDGGLYRAIQDMKQAGQNVKPSENPALWTRIGNPADEYPEWFQPIGAHDAYDKGAKVAHKGKRWISNLGANVWEPGVYGWTEVI